MPEQNEQKPNNAESKASQSGKGFFSPFYLLPNDLPDDADLNTIRPAGAVYINERGDMEATAWTYNTPDGQVYQPNNNPVQSQPLPTSQPANNAAPTAKKRTVSAAQAAKSRRFLEKYGQKWFFAALSLVVFCVVMLILLWPSVSQTLHKVGAPAPRPVTLAVVVRSQETSQYQMSLTEAVQRQTAQVITANVSLSATGQATGHTEIADGYASGPIRLLNTSGAAVYLPAGTLIATANNGVGYHLTTNISVPATNVAAGTAGFTSATVQADKPGTIGNISGLGSFSLRGGTLQVAGLGPIGGGTTRSVVVPSQQDIDKAVQELQAQLPDAANSALNAKLPSGDGWQRVIANSFDAANQQTNAPKAGVELPASTQNNQFTVSLTVQVSTVVVNPTSFISQMAGPDALITSTLSLAAVNPTATVAAITVSQGGFVELGPARLVSASVANSQQSSTLNMTYSRQVSAQPLIDRLTNWQGTQADLASLVQELPTQLVTTDNQPVIESVIVTGNGTNSGENETNTITNTPDNSQMVVITNVTVSKDTSINS